MAKISYRGFMPLFAAIILTLVIMSKPLFAQDQSMFEGFWTYCVDQATEETHVHRKNLYEFSEDEIVQLGESLGWSDFPEAVWAPNDGSWLIIDMTIDEPGLCQAMSINDPVNQNVNEWNEKIANDDRFRSRGVADVEAGRSRGWATTPVHDGFVQISLMNILLSTEPFANLSILTAVRVGLSPASCELFPSKCD